MHKYETVLNWLSDLAANEEPGTRIPTEKELSAKFGVSAMTVRRALQILTESGRLRGVPGSGTFVARPRVTKVMEADSSFSDAMRASGRTPSSQLLEATLTPADTTQAQVFGVPQGTMVYVIRRVRLGDGEPLGYEVSTLESRTLPGLLGYDLETSLYDIVTTKYNIDIERIGLVVSARLPSHEEAQHLRVEPATPCLQTVVSSRVRGGQVFEHTVSLFRGDLYEVALN
jgi:GntR family transcriptional regulator